MKKLRMLLSSLFLGFTILSCNNDDDVEPLNMAAQNVNTVERYLEGIQNESQDIFLEFAPSPSLVVKMNADASQTEIVFANIDQIRGYINSVFALFSKIEFNDVRITPSENGSSVFAQANGDFTVEGVGSPYRNVYIFRIDFNSVGEVTKVEEYFNQVVNGQFLGQPLGSCQEVICN
jgi:ketosteroid isomerase-like protein